MLQVKQTHDAASNMLKVLEDLDEGIINHTTWLKQLHRTLICSDDSPNPDDMREDAHCHCRFGQWYYQGVHPELNKMDQFSAIGEFHKSMHDSARRVLQLRQQGSPINIPDYNAFIDISIDFKLKVRELQHEIIQKICVVDHLTGVWNRQSMSHRLEQERERIMRKNSHCTLCMLDIDHFKEVNDRYGHAVGDQVLRKTAERCTTQLRSYDSIFRYGGEEFLLCMPELGAVDAEVIIERLRQHIAATPFELDDGCTIPITASFGITQMGRDKSVQDTIIEADHALLCAKSMGRNRICRWGN